MNRGRIQAQGENTEKSSPWATHQDITKNNGITKVDNLENNLAPAELRKRVDSLNKVRTRINTCGPTGITAVMKKSYYDDHENRKERVDLEVLNGVAFIDDPDINQNG